MNTEDAFEGDPTKRNYKKTMSGWELLLDWADKNQPKSWITFKDLKELYPIQVVEYAEIYGISVKPVFFLWVPCIIRKRINMIYKVRYRYWKRMHKYSIKIPNNHKHAMQLDKQNGTKLWRLYWEKEMNNVQVAFDIKYEGEVAPVGYQEFGCH